MNHLKPEDKTNLYYKNFEWVTQHENTVHARKYHLQEVVGCEAHGMATLTIKQVEKICKLIELNYTNREIADELGITGKRERSRFRSVVRHIRAKKTWKPISRKYNF